jgi:tetratricopeptide (TPR) repeat protein
LAAQVAPSWSDPYYKLGHAYLNKADYEKAQEAFKKLLKLEPNSTRAAKVKKTLEDLEKIRK